MEDQRDESTTFDVTVTRLPQATEATVREHLVRWHGYAAEDVRPMSKGWAFGFHEIMHQVAEDEGKTLGHSHDLTRDEMDLLEQGAQAALRRST